MGLPPAAFLFKRLQAVLEAGKRGGKKDKSSPFSFPASRTPAGREGAGFRPPISGRSPGSQASFVP